MPSYAHLAAAYDQLFPLDPDIEVLLNHLLGTVSGQTIVDAGCGTGALVEALAQAGARAHGFDLDPDLLARAQTRRSQRASFALGDLTRFLLPEGLVADAVVCLGNTAAHLLSSEALLQFLGRVRAASHPRAVFVLQVLDYERLMRRNQLTLPELRSGAFTFRRHYTVQASGLWRFHTSLESPEGRGEGAFDLKPWTRRELEKHFIEAGFTIGGVWGGFDRRPAGSSLPLVVAARLQ